MTIETAVCDVCLAEEQSTDIESTASYECVCSDCRSEMWTCNDCSDEFTASDEQYDTPNGTICEDCRHGSDYCNCDSCGDIIALQNGDYYNDQEFSGEIVCHNCSDSVCTDCVECGADIYFYEVGTDHYYDQRCEECYNRNDQSIGAATNSMSRSVTNILTANAYSPLSGHDYMLLSRYYNNALDDYEHNRYVINKNALGPRFNTDEGDAWWNGQIKLTSPVYKRTAAMLSDMMKLDLFLDQHKKYGLYHPLRHIFRSCLKYYHRSNGEYVDGCEVSMETLGQHYFDYPLEQTNREKIIRMLKDNKTDDGADLKRALNQVFSRAYRLKFPQYTSRTNGRTEWADYFQQYQTNVVSKLVDIQIGFDVSTLWENFQAGESLRSCQTPGNSTAYGFGAADMMTNPHLLAILRDEHGTLIGRSVIRLFKQQWDEEHLMMIAPSRIYLSQHSNVKNEVYVGLFQALNEWATETFTEGFRLIAYRHSRHDSSIFSFIRYSEKFSRDTTMTRPRLYTLDWVPFWETKPDNSEATFTYYQDEDQRLKLSSVRRDAEAPPFVQYSAREYISGEEYYIIEVENND